MTSLFKSKPKEFRMEEVTLVIASKVKAYLKTKDLRCSADTIAALSGKVVELLDAAAESAKADKRVTVKDRDIA